MTLAFVTAMPDLERLALSFVKHGVVRVCIVCGNCGWTITATGDCRSSRRSTSSLNFGPGRDVRDYRSVLVQEVAATRGCLASHLEESRPFFRLTCLAVKYQCWPTVHPLDLASLDQLTTLKLRGFELADLSFLAARCT